MGGLRLTREGKRRKTCRKKKVKMETQRKMNSDIPIDVLVDILTRLPAMVVWSLRSICKQWQSIIEAPSFADLHLSRSNEICLMVQRRDSIGSGSEYSYKTRFYSIDKDGKAVKIQKFVHSTKILTTCTNGLVCYMERDGNIKVCNLVTNELITLPKPTFLSQSQESESDFNYLEFNNIEDIIEVGIGFDCTTKKYKVFAVNQINPTEVEIFTLGGSNWWRKVQFPSSVKTSSLPDGLYANGFVYWFTYNEYHNIMSTLLTFNFTEEKFEFVPLPPDIDTRHRYRMMKEGGCLCIRDENQKKVTLWTLANPGKQVWVKQHIVLPPCIFRSEVYPISSGILLEETKRAYYKRHIYYYNEEGQIVKSIKVHGIPCYFESIRLHSVSLVSLKSIIAAAES